MDNKKVYVRDAGKYGKAVFASEDIDKGEIIAEFDGPIYTGDDHWTKDMQDHAVQFAEDKWRDSNGLARFINHSCEPNCGIKNLFKIVAMRDIKAGEEITWDYEMTEKNDWWRMKCGCGKSSCRKVIGNYDNMPKNVREGYKGYISEWLK